MEKIEKLKGDAFFLPRLKETNYGLAMQVENDPAFKFQPYEWINHVTPRQFLNIINRVKVEVNNFKFTSETDKERYKVFSYLSKFVEVLSSNLGLDRFDRETTKFEFKEERNHQPEFLYLSFYQLQIGGVKPGGTPSQKSNPFSKVMIENLYESILYTGMFKVDRALGDGNVANIGCLSAVFSQDLDPIALSRVLKDFYYATDLIK